MTVSVTTDWKYKELKTIILENEMVRMVILPELGAKIWSFIYKPKDREFLWHHPRIKPRELALHSSYDDNFFGGWDELYPNDLSESINGELLPDHGEIWTLPWEYQIENNTKDEVMIKLWVETPITSSKVEKWIKLKSGESIVHFHHKITNTGQVDQPFLWKIHAAMKIDENTRIDMGAKKVYIEDFGPPRNGKTGVLYDWPFLKDEHGNEYDMRKVLPNTSRKNEFQYGLELKDGWCSITDTKEKLGFGFTFNQSVLPTCWLFATYGGWRNLNTLVLEPCTGYPFSLHEGIKNGTHRILHAGESIECEVKAIIFEDVSGVDFINEDGKVFGS